MPNQITVWSQNRPGHLARITGALARAGVNITGLFASDAKRRSSVRLLVSSTARAKAALRKAGYRVSEEPTVMLSLPDKVGQLARVAAKLAKARINVNYGYATVGPGAKRACIVLGVGNAAKARRAIR